MIFLYWGWIMIIINSNYKLVMKLSTLASVRDECACHFDIYDIQTNRSIQTILRLDKARGDYTLFRWRNEGDLPKSFDTIKDGNDYRLKIIGVDEI